MNWISTPAHGYLKVARSDMQGFNPSSYSRENKGFYYLEEDCDAPEYLKHIWGNDWKTKYVEATITETWHDDHIDIITVKEN